MGIAGVVIVVASSFGRKEFAVVDDSGATDAAIAACSSSHLWTTSWSSAFRPMPGSLAHASRTTRSTQSTPLISFA